MQHAPIDSAYSYIEKRKAEILSLLQEFVEIPSCSREPEVMPAATEWVCTLLKNEGYQVRTWDVGHGNAPVIVADLKGQEEGAPVIFSGHYDTALYRELQAQNPFRIEDGKVYGTGVLDMKGGIVIAIYAVRAAVQAGLKRPIRLLLAGDEEINHLGSRCAEILTEEGAGALCALTSWRYSAKAAPAAASLSPAWRPMRATTSPRAAAPLWRWPIRSWISTI